MATIAVLARPLLEGITREPGATRFKLRGSGVQAILLTDVKVGELRNGTAAHVRVVETALSVIKCLIGHKEKRADYAALGADAMWELPDGTCQSYVHKMSDGAVALDDMADVSAGAAFLLAYLSGCKVAGQELASHMFVSKVLACVKDPHLVALHHILEDGAYDAGDVRVCMERRSLDPEKQYGLLEPDGTGSEISEGAKDRLSTWVLGKNMPTFRTFTYALSNPRASMQSINLFECVHTGKPDYKMPDNEAFEFVSEKAPYEWPTYLQNGQLRELNGFQQARIVAYRNMGNCIIGVGSFTAGLLVANMLHNNASQQPLHNIALVEVDDKLEDRLRNALFSLQCSLLRTADSMCKIAHMDVDYAKAAGCYVDDSPYTAVCESLSAAAQHVTKAVGALSEWSECRQECQEVQINVSVAVMNLMTSAPSACTASQMMLAAQAAPEKPETDYGCWANSLMISGAYVIFTPSLLFVLAATAGLVGVLVAWLMNTLLHAVAATALVYSTAAYLGGWAQVRCAGEVGFMMVIATFCVGILIGHVVSMAAPAANVE
jgi:hypothetical protein